MPYTMKYLSSHNARTLATICLMSALCFASIVRLEAEETVERTVSTMGTSLRVTITATDREAAVRGSERVIEAVEQTNERLSTWTDDSELARLNRTPVGEPFEASELLAEELNSALACAQRTESAFDPVIGALVSAWNLREGGTKPSAERLETAVKKTGHSLIDSPTQRQYRRLAPEATIEEGAFGKGAALAQAVELLQQWDSITSAQLSLGGQLAVLSQRSPVEIAIAHPSHRDRRVLSLRITHGSVATSGNSERAISIQGQRRSHILDPRSGMPTARFGSVSVWSPNPLLADCLSTALYVMGPDRALSWASAQTNVEAVVLTHTSDGLVARYTSGLDQRIQSLVSHVSLRSWTQS